MSRQDIIRDATLEARKKWLQYSIDKEKEIMNLLKASANNIIEKIERYTIAGKVPPENLQLLYNTIKAEMEIIRTKLRDRILTMMKNSVDFGLKSQIEALYKAGIPQEFLNIGSSFIDDVGAVHKWDAKISTMSNSMWGQINAEAIDFLLNNNPQGVTLSQRIWDVTWATEKSLRSALEQAVLEGRSAASLSRDIRGYLYQPEKLFRRVRKDGKLVLSNAAKNYHPGQGIYRSSYKNAMRVARTEMARAYSEGSLRYAATKEFIRGVIWRTGSGNPCPDCQTLEGTYYDKGNIETAIPLHPQCMCWWEMVLAKAFNDMVDKNKPTEYTAPNTYEESQKKWLASHSYKADFGDYNISKDRQKKLMDSIMQQEHYMAQKFPEFAEHSMRKEVIFLDGDANFVAQTRKRSFMSESSIDIHYRLRASKTGAEGLLAEEKVMNSFVKRGSDFTFGNGSNFGSIYRHEIGHNVWFSSRSNQKDLFIQSYIANPKAFGKISKYASSNYQEAFAELFAVFSSPAYKPGIIATKMGQEFSNMEEIILKIINGIRG